MEQEETSILTMEDPPETKIFISCNPVCGFSQQHSNELKLKHQSKMARKLCGIIILYTMFMIILIIGGFKSNSLAVLTDAAHLLTDVVSFSVSLFALRASRWKPTFDFSFGFSRLEVLGALLSVQLIWLVSGFIIYEAVNTILHGSAVSAIGSMVNFIMLTWLDHDHEKNELCDEESKILSISIEGGYSHVTEDMMQSIGVMITGGIIWAKPEWFLIDLICTLVYSVLSLSSTLSILRNIYGILMERTPSHIDVARLKKGIKCMIGVRDIHDLYIWAINVGKVGLSCHVQAEPGGCASEILYKIRGYCEKEYRICHVTIQIE